jgi:hypothetical protein
MAVWKKGPASYLKWIDLRIACCENNPDKRRLLYALDLKLGFTDARNMNRMWKGTLNRMWPLLGLFEFYDIMHIVQVCEEKGRQDLALKLLNRWVAVGGLKKEHTSGGVITHVLHYRYYLFLLQGASERTLNKALQELWPPVQKNGQSHTTLKVLRLLAERGEKPDKSLYEGFVTGLWAELKYDEVFLGKGAPEEIALCEGLIREWGTPLWKWRPDGGIDTVLS